MPQTSFIVPGVITPPREIDLTIGAKFFSKSIGGAVLVSRQGPLDNRFITRVENFDEFYGLPDPSWSFGHYCIRKFLRKGEGCWVRRVQRLGRHAGSIIYNDKAGAAATQTFFRQFKTGRFDNYVSGSQKVFTWKFSSALKTGNVVTISYSPNPDGSNPSTVSGTFADSNDATLELLAAALELDMNNKFSLSGKNDGQVQVNNVGKTLDNDRIITIVAPEDVDLYIQNIAVTGGTTQPSSTVYQDTNLLEVYAENPGAWANDIGYKIVKIFNGVKQRIQITFNTAIQAGQSIHWNLYFKSPVTGLYLTRLREPIPFTTDSLTTYTTFANQLRSLLGGSPAEVLVENNGQLITITAPTDGDKTVELRNFAIVNDDALSTTRVPAIVVTEMMKGVDNTNSFEFLVYTRDDINNYIERRVVSFIRQVDGEGQQLYIEDVINNNSVTRSNYVRVKYNTENTEGKLNIPVAGTEIYWLGGGDSGVLPTTGDMVIAWDAFKSRQRTPMRILINCGLTAVSVQQKMNNLAAERFDCIAILDNPSDKQEAQTAYENRQTNFNIQSSYSAIYTPDVLELDEFTNNELFVPPSGHVAAQYAETDAVAAEWFAPAGLNRAILDTAIGLRQEYDEDQMALLISAQLNPIINRNGQIVIWDQLTSLRKPSAFRNVSLRRLLITVEVSIVDGLDYTIHEPNDDFTAMAIIQICVSVLQPIKEGRGLYDYAAISDDRNNKDYDYNNQQRNVDVILDPILPIRTIRLTSVVTKKGAAFSEVVTAINGGSVSLGA